MVDNKPRLRFKLGRWLQAFVILANFSSVNLALLFSTEGFEKKPESTVVEMNFAVIEQVGVQDGKSGSTPPINTPVRLIEPEKFELREWSTPDLRFKVIAKLVHFKQGIVTLEKDDGNTVQVGLERLCRADHKYLGAVVAESKDSQIFFGISKLSNRRGEFVLEVIDGNVFRLVLEGVQFPVDVFAPDYQRVMAPVSELIQDKRCWCEINGTDSAGRFKGILFIDGKNINLHLIATGVAWYDPKAALGGRYENAQHIAKADRLGVWGTRLLNPLGNWP
jgi:hypothetical protein